jgi:hypothetical protein
MWCEAVFPARDRPRRGDRDADPATDGDSHAPPDLSARDLRIDQLRNTVAGIRSPGGDRHPDTRADGVTTNSCAKRIERTGGGPWVGAGRHDRVPRRCGLPARSARRGACRGSGRDWRAPRAWGPKLIRTMLRVGLVAPLVGIGLGAASAAAHVGPAAALCVQAGAAHRVGIVVEHGDGKVVRRCVGFAAPTVSAIAVLQASGIETGTVSFGAIGTAVCQIDGEPASYPPTCFTGSGPYWELFVAPDGGPWTSAPKGASLTTVLSGDDVGFRYNPQAGPDPPPVSPAGTCPAATAAPVPTSVPATNAPAKASPATSHVPAPTQGASPSAASTGGVLGLSSPAVIDGPAAGVPPAASVGGSISPGLLTGACGAGALLGLLGVQLARRRRR